MFGEVRLGDIQDRIAQEWRLFLCKPDTTIIAPIKDVEDITWNIRAGVVDEITFTIPAIIDKDHQMVDNPLIEMIKHRYLIKLIYNNRETYLVHNEDDKNYTDNETVTYKAHGRGYMLRDKTIRGWSATSKNLQYMLDEVLQETNWKVGFVDADINSKYRSHEVSNNNVLEIVYELVEKFGGLIVWDTVNLTINVYKPQNVGNDKGFRLREGKYLESFNQNTSSDEVVTRLKVYGKDGLTFRRLSPTGSNYIEDFSWFLYPFEMDGQGNVIQHSNYMSDGLAKGIVEYQNYLAGIQGQFDSLTTQLTSKQDEIKQREQELSVLLTELKVIVDELDVYNSTGSGNVTDITNRRNAKQAEIDSKASQISTLQNQEKSIQSQLDSLRTNVQMSNFLNSEQMLELNDYIITKDYTNDSIVDEEDLLKDGIEAFKTFRQPKVKLDIDIVNFLQNLESQNDWDKLNLGDTVYIKNSRLKVDISAKITEIQFNLTGNDIVLTLANEHEILDSDELFLKKIYDAANTSTSVNMNQWKWNMVEETNSLVHRLLNEGLNAAERAITAGYKQNISISERGIILKSDQEPHKWIVMQNGVIGLTNDNGNTWQVAITPDGVYAQTLVGKIIMGSKLIIEDEDGIIRLSGSKQEIFDAAGNEKVVLGNYADGKYGIKINNGALEIVNGLPENQIDPNAVERWNNAEQNAVDRVGRTIGDIRGDLRLTAPLPTSISMDSSGITAYSSTSGYARLDYRGLFVSGGAFDIRTSSSTNRGVKIDGTGIHAYNTSGTRTFHVDTNGNLTANNGSFGGRLDSANGTFTGTLSAVDGVFTGELRAATGTFTGSLSAVDGTFEGELKGATGTFSGTLSAGSISSSTITGGTIKGASIEGTTLRSEGYDQWGSRQWVNIGGGMISFSNGTEITQGRLFWTFGGTGQYDRYIDLSGSYFNIYSAYGDIIVNAGNGYKTKFVGNVDFSSASVSGLTVSSTVVLG